MLRVHTLTVYDQFRHLPWSKASDDCPRPDNTTFREKTCEDGLIYMVRCGFLFAQQLEMKRFYLST